jgi:pyruvate formate lyase activating enzyme
MSAETAIANARKLRCAGIAWTYNEPVMWLEYTIDGARLARKNRLYTVYVTNGYLTPQALDLIGPFLDAWRVDIKGFSDSFYERIAKIQNWRSILEVTKRAKKKWGMHIEVVTNVIPTLNDDDEQLMGIAAWIRDELGPLTPWHVTRFYPHHKLANLPATPVQTLDRAVAAGRDIGLKFVYTGNIPGREENTVCYKCEKLIISRTGYNVQVVGANGSRCNYCGAELNLRTWIGSPGQQAPVGGI